MVNDFPNLASRSRPLYLIPYDEARGMRPVETLTWASIEKLHAWPYWASTKASRPSSSSTRACKGASLKACTGKAEIRSALGVPGHGKSLVK